MFTIDIYVIYYIFVKYIFDINKIYFICFLTMTLSMKKSNLHQEDDKYGQSKKFLKMELKFSLRYNKTIFLLIIKGITLLITA